MSVAPALAPLAPPVASLAERVRATRALSLQLAAPLSPEDCVAQSMPDASPVKWHLAHTSWFFEQFVLVPHLAGYQVFDPQFSYLFNSYYESVGPRHCRPQRGLITRPTLDEVHRYRTHVDEALAQWFQTRPASAREVDGVVELGINHEQQHQELLLTDVKHLFSRNPLWPAYAAPRALNVSTPDAMTYRRFKDGVYEIGHADQGFHFDNEAPRHRQYLHAYALADRLVTNSEYAQFVRDGGYQSPDLWLSDGWATVQAQGWARPIYWTESLESEFTLGGECPLADDAPVCHVSFYEADAFARWAQARLPSEAEWEVAARNHPPAGNLLQAAPQDVGAPHPRAASGEGGQSLQQLYGDVWEWTASPYSPYPGFAPLAGGLGEYNGKFMANQFVLRGGSCATPAGHVRATYRNFFYPHARWQFSGIRLARSAAS